MFNKRMFIAIISAVSFWHAFPAYSQDQTVLTVTIADEMQEFSMPDLLSLPSTTIETTTIWTDGVQEFEGVSLDVFLAEINIESGSLRATAINDYAVEIPVSDAVEGGPILAYSRNGEPMSVRDKGPIWIVYPFDSDPLYQSEVIYSRSIWQLDRLALIE